MPYASILDLPPGVRDRLPVHAQEIYASAFNAAWERHAGAPDREAIAHRIAWAAVKRGYRKAGNLWVAR